MDGKKGRNAKIKLRYKQEDLGRGGEKAPAFPTLIRLEEEGALGGLQKTRFFPRGMDEVIRLARLTAYRRGRESTSICLKEPAILRFERIFYDRELLRV